MRSWTGRRSEAGPGSGRGAVRIAVALLAALAAPAAAEPASPLPADAIELETASLIPEPHEDLGSSHRPEAAWRLSRSELLQARAYPEGDARKRPAFERARERAQRARDAEPACAECCLYEFAATAQLATLGSAAESLRYARQAGRVLETCLAAPPPGTVNADGSSEQAKLYFGASQYFRRLPRSSLLSWILGVRGDSRRAVVLARDALALEPDNPEYRFELAATLLCRVTRHREPAGHHEAWLLLEGLKDAEDEDLRAAAAALAEEPQAACGYGPGFPGID